MAIRALRAGAGLLGTITDILPSHGQLPPIPSTPLPGSTHRDDVAVSPWSTAADGAARRRTRSSRGLKIAQKFTGNAGPRVSISLHRQEDKFARIAGDLRREI